jgi:hypothetical protein
MACDVFEEAPAGSNLGYDAGDVWPEVAFIIRSATLAGGAERLAGIARKDDVDMSAPGITNEGSHVSPHRGRAEISSVLPCDDCVLRVFFPLDKARGMEARLCEHEAKVEATGACAEGEAGDGGMYAHVISPSAFFYDT